MVLNMHLNAGAEYAPNDVGAEYAPYNDCA